MTLHQTGPSDRGAHERADGEAEPSVLPRQLMAKVVPGGRVDLDVDGPSRWVVLSLVVLLDLGAVVPTDATAEQEQLVSDLLELVSELVVVALATYFGRCKSVTLCRLVLSRV